MDWRLFAWTMFCALGCGRIGYELFPLDAASQPSTSEVGGSGPLAFGDGHWGALRVLGSEVVVNQYGAFTQDAVAGATSIHFENFGEALRVSPGDLLFVWQPVGTASTGVGAPAMDLGLEALGHWELVRALNFDGSQAELQTPLRGSYLANFSQVVVVPEFTRLEVPANASLSARAWNGRLGGVLVLAVSEGLQLDGALDVSAKGLRGGANIQASAQSGCTGLDEAAPRGAQRGESIVIDAYGPSSTGRGNRGNGGGGGVCHNAGGGGGGNGGAGGQGAYSWDGGRDVGGLGGSALVSSAERFSLGGAGGTGETNSTSTGTVRGGNGGGAVLLFASRIEGSGSILARGGEGGTVTDDGAGGGGAGGSVVLHADSISCEALDVRGGKGGDAAGGNGAAGGGGGGYVFSRQPLATCPARVEGGLNGLAESSPRGAGPGRSGRFEAPP